mmetsp:Transcript_58232/g.69447  ORF Transcript_58232/g.69447 Transcript_58232/m.69447 type:complete len:125 (+) Transcript_58232:1773-2147(+)
MTDEDNKDVMMRTNDDDDVLLKATILYFEEYDFDTDLAFAANPAPADDVPMKAAGDEDNIMMTAATRGTKTTTTDTKIITTNMKIITADMKTTTSNDATSDSAADKPFHPPPKPPPFCLYCRQS